MVGGYDPTRVAWPAGMDEPRGRVEIRREGCSVDGASDRVDIQRNLFAPKLPHPLRPPALHGMIGARCLRAKPPRNQGRWVVPGVAASDEVPSRAAGWLIGRRSGPPT